MSQTEYRVLILGAGLAGLSAAAYLCQNGIGADEILILEAKEKAGGRILSSKFSNDDESSSPGWMELGAQWIHGEENELCDEIKSTDHLHSKASWEGEGDFLIPGGEKVERKVVREILDWVQHTLEYIEDNLSIKTYEDNPKIWKNVSIGKYLSQNFDDYLLECGESPGTRSYDIKMAVFQWAMSFQRIDNCCNQMEELSLFRWSEFQVNAGEHYNNFAQGAQNFVDDVLVAPLPTGLLRLSCPVTKINWATSPTEIVTGSGVSFYAQCVLVTFSIGVLQAMHKQLFTPPLPNSLARAIESTGFGPLTKIFLEWDEPWWSSDLKGFQLIWPNEFINCCNGEINPPAEELENSWHKAITGFDPVLDAPKVLLAWMGGPEAVFVESLSNQEIGSRCAKVLRDFTQMDVPEPKRIQVSRWTTDEFFRGAYCYRSTKGDDVNGDITAVLSTPVTQVDDGGFQRPAILLAGEALHQTSYSTLHGAYESGRIQANVLLSYFRQIQGLPLKCITSSSTSDKIFSLLRDFKEYVQDVPTRLRRTSATE